MGLPQAFGHKSVLTASEAYASLDDGYSSNVRTRQTLLAYHVRQGHLLRIRRGLYAVVSPGNKANTVAIDPFLVAGKLAEDAVIAYHTALAFHAKAYSVSNRYLIQSSRVLRPLSFRSNRFEGVPFPRALRSKRKEHFATILTEHAGVEIRVATLERTLVDLMDRPRLGGGWEEIWRGLESVEFFDVDLVVKYALLLDNATTTAKVGFYLEQHANTLKIQERHLRPLRAHRPKQPHYLGSRRGGKFLPGWNLMVPVELIDKPWEEPT